MAAWLRCVLREPSPLNITSFLCCPCGTRNISPRVPCRSAWPLTVPKIGIYHSFFSLFSPLLSSPLSSLLFSPLPLPSPLSPLPSPLSPLSPLPSPLSPLLSPLLYMYKRIHFSWVELSHLLVEDHKALDGLRCLLTIALHLYTNLLSSSLLYLSFGTLSDSLPASIGDDFPICILFVQEGHWEYQAIDGNISSRW